MVRGELLTILYLPFFMKFKFLSRLMEWDTYRRSACSLRPLTPPYVRFMNDLKDIRFDQAVIQDPCDQRIVSEKQSSFAAPPRSTGDLCRSSLTAMPPLPLRHASSSIKYCIHPRKIGFNSSTPLKSSSPGREFPLLVIALEAPSPHPRGFRPFPSGMGAL